MKLHTKSELHETIIKLTCEHGNIHMYKKVDPKFG